MSYDEAVKAFPKCEKYLKDTAKEHGKSDDKEGWSKSCDWTKEWSCKGQKETSEKKGDAGEDGSIGYTCCCEHKLFKMASAAEGDEVAPTGAVKAEKPETSTGPDKHSEEHPPVEKDPEAPTHKEEPVQEAQSNSGPKVANANKSEHHSPTTTESLEHEERIDHEIAVGVEAHRHAKTMERIEKKIDKFNLYMDRMLGRKVKEVPLDGTPPMLVRAPGAEPVWIKANWRNPVLDQKPITDVPKDSLQTNLKTPEQDAEGSVAGVSGSNIGFMLPVAFLAPRLPGAKNATHDQRSQACRQASAFL